MDFPEKPDVVVVGGGPIGGITAKILATNGLNTLVLEEHGSIGEPVHCAGLISVDGFRRLGIFPSKGIIQNKVRGATIFSASGTNVTIERQSEQAFVVDRVLLDRQIVDEASRRGSVVAMNTKAALLETNRKEAVVTADVRAATGSKMQIKIRPALVASCEGHLSSLSKQIGLDIPNQRMRLYGTQYEMTNVNLERQDIVQMYLGRNIAPGFFAWVIPTGPDSARVGLASKVPRTISLLKHFTSRHPPSRGMFRKAKVNRTYGGTILTGGPIRRTYSDRFIAIGDCAGQTKPTTGGGVVTGGRCAQIGAQVILKSAETGDFSREFLSRYQKMWKREIGREFFTMLLARRLLNCLPDGFMDRLISTATKSGLARLIENQGSIDQQSGLLRSFVTHPRVIVSTLLSLLGIV